MARALIAAGYAESVQDAFERILGYGMPGYVPRQGLGPVEAIRAIRAAGGLASLAHFPRGPRRTRRSCATSSTRGLNGLETHHASFRAPVREAVGAVARSLGLVETGGTDYHGDYGPYAESHDWLVMPDELVAGLRVALGR